MVENDQFVADAVFASPENMQRLSSVAPVIILYYNFIIDSRTFAFDAIKEKWYTFR